MEKYLSLIAVILILFTGCEKEFEEIIPEDDFSSEFYDMGEEISKKYGLNPVDADDIKHFIYYMDKDKNKYLFGAKQKERGKESFWFSKYDSDGKSLFDIVHEDKQFDSRATIAAQIANGDIVVSNVLKTGSDIFDMKSVSPVVVTQDGEAKFVETKEGYFYSDALPYNDFFFTIISDEELNKISFASNCAYQIDNSGNVMRFFSGGTDELQLPEAEGNYIWLSDSTYATISKEHVSKRGISKMMHSDWDFTVNLPSHNTCDINLSVEDTFLNATYKLEYSNSKKDTLIYKIAESNGVGFLISGEVDEGELVYVDVSGSTVIIDGYVTGNVNATFRNNSQKEVKVTRFKVYDTIKDSIMFDHKEDSTVTYENPLVYNLNLNMVYLPLFVWEYDCDGKTYTVSCGI